VMVYTISRMYVCIPYFSPSGCVCVLFSSPVTRKVGRERTRGTWPKILFLFSGSLSWKFNWNSNDVVDI
jgi:hypothetical protein